MTTQHTHLTRLTRPTRRGTRALALAAGLAAGTLGGAAARAQAPAADSAGAALAAAPPAARARPTGTRPVQLRPGDVVRLYVWREPEMSRDYEVDDAGAIDLPKLGPIAVAGVSPDSLRRVLEARYAKYLRTPTVEVTTRRRVSVLGSVRNPGVYQVDPYVTVADVLALAGGPTPDARVDEVRVLRGDRSFRTRVSTRTVIADSPVQSGDQLYVPDRGWVTRNLTLISAAVSAVGVVVFAARR